ncbi:MAG: hypothetical protein JWR51_3959 [Devosia sp.]|uniref:COG4223 family protein n=1 Tax=Devosia sp. TaxID=1871048 RepID=UPI00261C3143|nr:hypothetical protein [Devosia sp.]MDB5530856.1 hypothetical protein [Devosia sp.]
MVDPKRDDPKPSETKSGPVKPPVLDLKARETRPEGESVKPEAAKPAEPKDAAAKPTPPKAPASAEPEREFAFGAAIAGAVLGLAAAYGLALLGYWPSAPAPVVQADPRVAQLGSAIPELQTVTQTTQSELAALNARVAGLEKAGGTAVASAPPVDLGGIQADIAALSARVEGLGAAPANAVAPADIDALKTDLAGFGTRLDELGARIGTTEAGVRTLETSVTATTAALAEQPSDVGAVLQLPLVLSGFESAFATGRPYETELAALRAAVPTASIPTDIANGATTGLTRPDVIASRFAAVLPAMLAGRPANPDAGWQDGALDWLRSAIALRPTGELPGDDPEAVVSRLEAAIGRRDYAAAETLMSSLPAPMQAAAGDVPALIRTQAEAGKFLEALRTQALNGSAS